MLADLDDWIDEWILVKQGEGLSERAQGNYRRELGYFGSWVDEHHPEVVSVVEVTTKQLREWSAWIGKYADSTRQLKIVIVKAFFGYLASEPDSGIDINPAATLVPPKVKDPPVPIIIDADLSALLGSMTGRSFKDLRDTVIVRLLVDCGLRRFELIGLNVEDLDLRRQEVTVHGKGGKIRIVPFGAKTALALRKYLRARERQKGAGCKALILSFRSHGAGEYRLSGSGLATVLDMRLKSVGLEHKYPHQFRHTWAHDLKEAGMSDSDLERLAGWSTPAMSRRYGNSLADERARGSARRLSRGDRV